MAVTKTHPIKSTLKAAIDYILNPEKTDGKLLASSFGCGLETADIEFAWTREAAGDRGTHLGRHLIQSFAVGETTPEEAHKIGMELAGAVLGGKYEFVLTTHVDKDHLHNHLIFNAVSFVDYKKYHSNKQSYHFIRRTSDRICKEHGLSVVVPGQDKGKSYAEYTAEKQGTSYKAKLKTAIDTLIPQVKDFDELLRRLQEMGYEIKQGKYISFRAAGQERFTRTKTLGAAYTEEAIKERIKGVYVAKTKTLREDKKIRLVVDLENSIKAQQSAGYERWAKIHNLKQAATPLRDAAIPVYREAAMYAFEAGELDAYRTSMQANMDCKEAIEQTINDYYGNNRLAAESAVKSILEKFSPERVAYVLAQTIQQKDHDGRISPDCKEWAKGMDGSPDHAAHLIIDSVNPGLVSLFTEEFVRQTAISRTQEQAPAEQSKPAVPEKAPEAPAPKEPEQAAPVKHRLTPEEKKIKEAVMDTLKAQIAGRNDGMLSTYRSSNQSFKVMMEYKVRIEGNTVTRDGEPMFAIHRRHSAKKVQGCYRELTPTLEYIGKEKTQEAAREKPSIREHLRAAAKSQPERKTPVKQKSHDVGLE